ncbi:MAG: sigma-54 dependent transcriptional regulator [Thermodesulfobacteriota bacterium]|jgi:DNA-binding NtrC family response regulator|nr:sigma-54 dependent transcriptional regulator [Thermodesulfobacteriota bacterium]
MPIFIPNQDNLKVIVALFHIRWHMLIRLVLATKQKDLQRHLERKFDLSDVRVESFGRTRDIWQSVVRSCGDIIVISESIIPRPSDTGIAILNDLPENPTTVVLHHTDDSEEFAKLVAAGADVVLYEGTSKKNLAEAIEATLESRRQFVQKKRVSQTSLEKPKITDFYSSNEAMRIFIEEVEQVIPSSSPILILGETGVGKEHLAKAIHADSPRAAGPFITVNTAALPEQLLESELFGHEQGAFTGAIRTRKGAFELAHRGTIFLDEIGDMPIHLQANLLRVLQDYEVKPIGGERPFFVDVRVIASTNHDLEKEVESGTFRKDLFYRLSVVALTIPPLRHRVEDIPDMARYFVNYYQHKIGREINRISESAMKSLCRYDWPGNVRELMNVIERAMLICKSDVISRIDLPSAVHSRNSDSDRLLSCQGFSPKDWDNKTLPEVQKEALDHVEKKYLEMVLKKTHGRVGRTAQIAGIHQRALYNKMRRLGLRKEDFKK